jgi:hypothetical protein
MKITMRSENERITNGVNMHTCAVGCPNLIITVVRIMHGEFIQFTCDIISSSRVKILNGIGTMRCSSSSRFLVLDIFFVEAIPADVGHVSRPEADLATRSTI